MAVAPEEDDCSADALTSTSTITRLTSCLLKGCNYMLNNRAQELCESRGGCPGIPSLIYRTVSVDVKQH